MGKHKATWNGVVLAESDKCESVEGNWYFPPDSINRQYFKPSDHTSVCSWKGMCNYNTIEVNGKRNDNATWIYQNPKPAAQNIAGYFAFWKGVEVE